MVHVDELLDKSPFSGWFVLKEWPKDIPRYLCANGMLELIIMHVVLVSSVCDHRGVV